MKYRLAFTSVLILVELSLYCVVEGGPVRRPVIASLDQDDMGGPSEPVLLTPSQPVIIWFHTVNEDPNVLRTAISSNIFTYVMLEGMHPYDLATYSQYPRFREALKICKDAGVKIIWSRWLWPGYNLRNFARGDVFNPDYYSRQISNIKKEALQMGADYTALDLEPYGNAVVMEMKKRNLTASEFVMIPQAINDAVNAVGQVDYVLPAALPYPRHTRFTREIYKSLQGLGKFSIAEHTYYNNESGLHCENNVFDVFGAYCKKDPNRPQYPTVPYFSPREILERQDLWAHKKGLFIYPGIKQDLWETAMEFSKIRTIQLQRNK